MEIENRSVVPVAFKLLKEVVFAAYKHVSRCGLIFKYKPPLRVTYFGKYIRRKYMSVLSCL